ncbi:MAG: F0F1 ATP synthase subunit B [Candidatus Omnitrophica bacterium]|nr:F0F1 ATP synthase subunit B [Candidatus Omnitrophota bacterium]
MQLLAQFVTNILAFFLLLLILKKYAWGALLKLIDERRARIESEFRSIEEARQEIAKLKTDYQAHLAAIEEEARVKIQEAVKEGRRIAGEIEEAARAHSRETIEKTKEAVEQEVAKARVQLKEHVVDLAIQVTHKVFQNNLDEETDRRMIESFIREIDSIEKGNGTHAG